MEPVPEGGLVVVEEGAELLLCPVRGQVPLGHDRVARHRGDRGRGPGHGRGTRRALLTGAGPRPTAARGVEPGAGPTTGPRNARRAGTRPPGPGPAPVGASTSPPRPRWRPAP